MFGCDDGGDRSEVVKTVTRVPVAQGAMWVVLDCASEDAEVAEHIDSHVDIIERERGRPYVVRLGHRVKLNAAGDVVETQTHGTLVTSVP